jgi:hypothetical protein
MMSTDLLPSDRPAPEALDFFLRHRSDSARYRLLNEFRGKRIYRFALDEQGDPDSAASTLIVKTWDPRRGSLLRQIKRQLFGERSGCVNEFQMLRHLSQRAPGLGAPLPVASLGRSEIMGQEVEVALIGDLGPCIQALRALRESVQAGDEAAACAIEAFALRSVRSLIFDAQVIDNDHSLINMVLTAQGTLHRIDFEVAQHRRDVRRPDEATGLMLGRLIATHVYATQSHRLERSMGFMAQLRGGLPELPRTSWQKAAEFALYKMERQLHFRGFLTRLDVSALLS